MWTFEAVLRNCFLWKILLPSYKLHKILIITLGSHDLTCFSDMKAHDYFYKIQNSLSPCLFSNASHEMGPFHINWLERNSMIGL